MFAMLIFSTLQVAQQFAAGVSAPRPYVPIAQLFSFEDYPGRSLERQEYGIVSAVLHVSKEGKGTLCEVTETSGFPAIDVATCSIAKMRARFDPARDAAGNAVESAFPYSISWVVGERSQKNWKFELPIEVARLPPGYRAPMQARVTFDAVGE